MTRAQLIEKYENMMCKYGEFDAWDCDIEPKLSNMSMNEIKTIYKKDKEFYEAREKAGGYFG